MKEKLGKRFRVSERETTSTYSSRIDVGCCSSQAHAGMNVLEPSSLVLGGCSGFQRLSVVSSRPIQPSYIPSLRDPSIAAMARNAMLSFRHDAASPSPLSPGRSPGQHGIPRRTLHHHTQRPPPSSRAP